ncbi:sigma factor-like helix-turn-helix DNA-binding protein [Streptomyces qinglanensis]|uniref:sigma factor-like helix-turn-helix DNA-binding protein n=1 Tax=Streptomyces qinglanensis TaxID=943816 RepID=UPI003D709A49
MVREGIDELVACLPSRQREVITRCVLGDENPALVAQRLQIKEELVRRYIKAAAHNLKKCIDEHGEEVSV